MITNIIIIITCCISVMSFERDVRVPEPLRCANLGDKLMFNPYLIFHHSQIWRLFTVTLVHIGWWHLTFNMWALSSFGHLVEDTFIAKYGDYGSIIYALFYISAAAAAGLYDLVKYRNQPYYRAAGASGAVSAIALAAILFEPTIKLRIFFIPIPMYGFIFAILYLAFSAFMEHKGDSSIAHMAHFCGAVYGIIFPLLLDPSLWEKCVFEIGQIINSFF